MKKIGVDITRISRFKNMKEKVYKKFLHVKEINELDKSKNKKLFLAKRWAIKEALFKADNNLFVFSKINITRKNKQYFYKDFLISTSSEKNYCIAFVIKEKNETKN